MPSRTINGLQAEPSRKRVRHAAPGDSDDEEVLEVQQARSNFRAEPRKRPRVSDVGDDKSERHSNRKSTPLDDDQDEAEPQAPTSPSTPPKTQYELMRDNNFEHLRNEALDDQRATQRLRFRPNLLGQSAIAENGIIESVTCINFMCHVRLHCELGPLLNFIVGENGSGKSAILTAITLCLGGKASSTNRGVSLKSFVKEGCERAVLIVKIKNRGQDAYKPDIYGESVIVERHFSKTGSSGFRVKTALGQVHSVKKQEVDDLVEYYALQVDNPLNILSQDNARQFLNSSTKTQKYKFFIEGVQLQQLDNDYRLISESLEQMEAKVPDQQERVKHAKVAMDRAQRLMDQVEGNRQIRHKLRILRSQIAWCQVEQHEEDLRKRENELKEAEIRLALQIADEKVERAEEALQVVKDEEGEVQERIQENKDREPEVVNRADVSKKALEKIDEEVRRKQNEINEVESRMKRLQEDRGSIWDAYEAQLLKPEWSSILEKTFGASLNAFLVTSKRDETLLRRMMNQLNIRSCPVFICTPHALDISGKEPDPEYDTILRVLKIDNQMVRDQLIINHMIEQIILIPERVRAQQVMFDGAPPRNVKACLAFHDRKRGEGLRLAMNNGNISTSPIQPNPNLKLRMKTDSDSQIALLRDSLQQISAEYQGLNAERRRLQQECQRCQKTVAQLKKDRNTLEHKLRTARNGVDEIQAELDRFESSDYGKLEGLKKNLEELKDELNHHGIQYGMLSAKKQDKNAEVEEAREKVKEQKQEMKDYEQRLGKAESKLKQVRELRHICLIEKNDIIARMEEYAGQKEKAERRRARQQDYIKDVIAQAETVSKERAYIPEIETYESLKKQYDTLRARLDNVEKNRGMSDQQVHDHFKEVREMYTQVIDDLESITTVNKRLRDSLAVRLEKWRKFQRYISSQSRANFIYLLSERGFRGKLILDHERKSLDLQVEPDKTEKRAAGRSTKTLSGGEKSFSSICLLLAIWEAMGSPLRCLDEFDVFMDNVNRAISTNMLITAARRSVNRQYIFITPNAIEGRTTLDKDVKIIRLTDPRQRTLADH
ncbi:P-loop containing nucleoside triphosphate hydrolase protein [Parathielavia appendiculata]|uniref:P-loop containing nucleoside triphosphate hydrolase protein n=1 Tax=Parathielavia appendiculata TaxID=2587402 RepID=A0AAN6U0J1_9PEZI|nr:P-loop containing nucleoside triphosphate hydrolase protein [Parathielavia appendiculata]